MRINLRKLKTDKRDGIPTGKVVYVNWLIAHQHSIGLLYCKCQFLNNIVESPHFILDFVEW